MERRINPSANEHNKLKAIAGMLRSLSYREMLQFVEAVERTMATDPSPEQLADALLQVSDAILEDKL